MAAGGLEGRIASNAVAGPEQSLKVAAHLEASPERVWSGGWHLHLQLLLHGAFSRSPFDQVRAVIGTALPPMLRGVGVDLVALPGEDPHWSATHRPDAHYPLVYQRVLRWIDGHVEPGQLVLVGGGLAPYASQPVNEPTPCVGGYELAPCASGSRMVSAA